MRIATRRAGAGEARGTTFLEALGTMAVLAIGLAGVGSVVSFSSRVARRNFAQTQAQAIAEQQLERIRALGCDPADSVTPCARIAAFDGNVAQVYWGANGAPAATAAAGRRLYDVFIDVDPPFEGAETGAPGVQRALPVAGAAGNAVNVRVTVRWDEEGENRFFALQTRMGP